mmetsp:Transcript_79474/g.228061  ORF Transcript_79474/g.228061 Transcript_79474/m.228061 type:complete len:200 (+) Transcript_79474:313-912(+)
MQVRSLPTTSALRASNLSCALLSAACLAKITAASACLSCASLFTTPLLSCIISGQSCSFTSLVRHASKRMERILFCIRSNSSDAARTGTTASRAFSGSALICSSAAVPKKSAIERSASSTFLSTAFISSAKSSMEASERFLFAARTASRAAFCASMCVSRSSEGILLRRPLASCCAIPMALRSCCNLASSKPATPGATN